MTVPRIVVGVDGSKAAIAALDWAVDEALHRHADLDVVHAWAPTAYEGYLVPTVDPEIFREAAQRALDAALVRARAHAEVRVTGRLIMGSPARELLDVAHGADLVVVGSRGHTGVVGLLLGSVANAVVHHATCPVVVVPAAAD